MRHIQDNHGRGCRLDHLARIAGHSKYHFLRMFHARTDMSLHRCVDRERVKAYREMSTAGMPLKAITKELGFPIPQPSATGAGSGGYDHSEPAHPRRPHSY